MGHRAIICKFGQSIRTATLGLILMIAASSSASAAELLVPIDESKVYILDQPVSTVAVTNPSIADVSIHNGKTILVIGRIFGTTNIIALDADGKPVATKRIRVTSSAGTGNVTYVRGPGIFSYSCAPRCERVLLPGDRLGLPGADIGPNTFAETNQEQTMRSGVAGATTD